MQISILSQAFQTPNAGWSSLIQAQLDSLKASYAQLYTRHLHNRHLRIITYRKILYAKRAICAQCWKFYKESHFGKLRP